MVLDISHHLDTGRHTPHSKVVAENLHSISFFTAICWLAQGITIIMLASILVLLGFISAVTAFSAVGVGRAANKITMAKEGFSKSVPFLKTPKNLDGLIVSKALLYSPSDKFVSDQPRPGRETASLILSALLSCVTSSGCESQS